MSLQELKRTLQKRLAYSEQDNQARCNLFNREDGPQEGGLQASLLVFASHSVTPKLILMLRSPVTHVRSMYSHCLHHHHHREIGWHLLSLVDWLRLYTNSSNAWEDGAPHDAHRYCGYNPVNYQTHLLSGDFRATRKSQKWHFLVPASAVDRVHSLVQTAFFVGVTEYYAHSVCLVRWLVTGQLPASNCAETARIEMDHNDHGNAADKTVLSGEELSLITQVSRIDELVYGFGLGRMYQDARKANFQLFRRA